MNDAAVFMDYNKSTDTLLQFEKMYNLNGRGYY